jgi:hypothetical protein
MLSCTGISSDGTEESNAQKLDISALAGAPSKVRIDKVNWNITPAMRVKVIFDHTTDVLALFLNGVGEKDYTEIGGFQDTGSGGSGDILFTTVGAAANEVYQIDLFLSIS